MPFILKSPPPPLSHQTLAPTGTDGFLIEEGEKIKKNKKIILRKEDPVYERFVDYGILTEYNQNFCYNEELIGASIKF